VVNDASKGPVAPYDSVLGQLAEAEASFLKHDRGRGADLESAVRVFLEFLRGLEYMDIDRPVVTVFGSARFVEGHRYYELAREVGRTLAERGFAVMTGAGPGIMEAANRGCQEAGGLSIGANIKLPKEQAVNPYVDRYVEFEHFFVRKVMLVKFSCAFIAMPGGFGTLDEIFEALTLMQTEKIDSFPVVCMDKEFWSPVTQFFQNTLIPEKTIAECDADRLFCTDSPEDAVNYIFDHAHVCSKMP
jgi:uncharacterized protein (TIGR00730 family)